MKEIKFLNKLYEETFVAINHWAREAYSDKSLRKKNGKEMAEKLHDILFEYTTILFKKPLEEIQAEIDKGK